MQSPDGKVHHVVDLIPPDEAPEGEAFELNDQDVGQTPQQQLLGGLAVLLALWTVPSKQDNRAHKDPWSSASAVSTPRLLHGNGCLRKLFQMAASQNKKQPTTPPLVPAPLAL